MNLNPEPTVFKFSTRFFYPTPRSDVKEAREYITGRLASVPEALERRGGSYTHRAPDEAEQGLDDWRRHRPQKPFEKQLDKVEKKES